MNWTSARAMAVVGCPVRRSGWANRWLSYSHALWWLTPFDAVTRVSGMPRVVQPTDWSRVEFTATDWTTTAIPEILTGVSGDQGDDEEASPFSRTWVVPKVASVAGPFGIYPNLVATSLPFFNPFSGSCSCNILSGQDDDTSVAAYGVGGAAIEIPLGAFVHGGDHASRGDLYGDPPIRSNVTIVLPKGGVVVLQSWDACFGNQGGTDTLTFTRI